MKTFLFVCFCCMTHVVSAQMIAENADTSFPAEYSMVLNIETDTINNHDSILFIDDRVAYSEVDSVVYYYDLIEDSIFTPSTAYYTLDTNRTIISQNDTLYYILTNDTTTYLYKTYDTSYTHHIYIHNLPEDAPRPNIGLLTALLPSDTGDADFTWMKYNQGNYDTIKKEYGVRESTIDSLSSGGYKVDITNAPVNDTSFFGWVFVNDLFLSLDTIKKEQTDTLSEDQYNCDFITLKSVFKTDTFHYYDIFKDSLMHLPNSINHMEWSSDNNDFEIPNPQNHRVFIQKEPFPYKDTWFYFDAKDQYGCQRQDEVFFRAIHTKAEILTYYRESEPIAEFSDKQKRYAKYESSGFDTLKGASPLKVILIDSSKNAIKGSWKFDDSYFVANTGAEIGATNIRYDTSHIYYVPDHYSLTLKSESWFECTDTDTLNIVVRKSKLEAPNFFSPHNNDGINDYFRVYSPSIRNIEIVIFNRWGDKVYDYSGGLEDWNGWNGKIKNSDREAPAGVYFYVINALGWEKNPPKKFSGEKYTGSIHLYE